MCRMFFYGMLMISFLMVHISCSNNSIQPKNIPPQAPGGLSGVPISSEAVILTWTDNSDNEDRFEIYRDWPVWNMIAEVPADFDFFVDSLLQDSTFYSYYVAAVNDYGSTLSTDTATISTMSVGQPPDLPHYPIPYDQAVVQDSMVRLEWYGNDPDGDPITFDLYFAMQSTPVLIDSNLSLRTYTVGPLETGMTYFWQVMIKDDHRHQTLGPVWSFRVAIPGR